MTEDHSPARGKNRLQMILDYARDYEQMWREERSATVEAEVTRALIESLDYVSGGKLALKAIKEIFNLDRPEGEKFSSKALRSVLTSLGFKKTRTNKGEAAIVFDPYVLKSRARQFGSLDALEKARRPTVEKLGDVTIEFLVDIDTSDMGMPNQPVFERFLGKEKRFTKGQRITVDQETANVLSMMGACRVIK